ncbi:hypothetical protein BDQ17DRAFT_1422364 [Cyathus striatus]|nr:hypothetical protein BDQ17DRAFT_1422364 [Cyathus striatus]
MRLSTIVVAAASFASAAIASPNSLAARQSCDLVVCIADILLLLESLPPLQIPASCTSLSLFSPLSDVEACLCDLAKIPGVILVSIGFSHDINT